MCTTRTLTEVIEDALRRFLSRRPAEGARGRRFSLPTFADQGLQAGVDLDHTGSLLDLMDRDAAP